MRVSRLFVSRGQSCQFRQQWIHNQQQQQQRNWFSSKVYSSPASAIAASGLKSGDTLLAGGFGVCGSPVGLAHAIGETDCKNLTVVSNNCGLNDYFLGRMLKHKQIKRMMSSYVGENDMFAAQYLGGELETEFVPQGSLAERLRAGGAGIPAFYTRTGVGTWIEKGGVPIKYNTDGSIAISSEAKESRDFNGSRYVMETGIRGEVAIVKAYQCDEFGNCRFRGTARNFNPLCAMAGKFTIVECEEIVPLGALKAEDIHLPGAFVHAIVQTAEEKRIELLKLRPEGDGDKKDQSSADIPDKLKSRLRIVKRAAQELEDGMVVNLGIGMPTMIPNYVPSDKKIWLQSENGLLGTGPYPTKDEADADYINAGKETVTLINGSSLFDSAESFAMIRGSHVDVSILGSMEVSANGDIANWMVPGAFVKGMGGAMDLVASGSRVIVTMEHCDKKGKSKIVNECKLPLTGVGCVSRIITDLAVFDITSKGGLELIELLDHATVDEVTAKTEPCFNVSPNLKQVSLVP